MAMGIDTGAPPAAPLINEIAVSRDGQDITRASMGAMAHSQDSVLRGFGGRWEAYREIRRDGQVHATFQQRRLAIVSRPLTVEPGAQDRKSKAAAKQLEANLQAIAFDRTMKLMSWGFFYGYGVGECMWKIQDGKVWLDRLPVRTPWRFRFTSSGELRLLTKTNMTEGLVMPERKFWTMSAGADNDDDPYGLGLAHQLYWPVYFKKQGLGFWLRALEKHGGPTTVGKYPPGTPPDQVTKLLQAAMAIRIDGAVAIPDNMTLEFLEAIKGSADQAVFHRQINGEISKIVLGQTMTTDDGASLSQSEVHFDVREELTDADVEDLCESFMAGPARWLTEWNFPGAATPILRRLSPEDDERASKLTKERAETIKTMGEAGYEPEEPTLADMFPGWRRKPEPAPATGQEPAAAAPIGGNVVALRPAFAEPIGATDAVDDFVRDLDWELVMAPFVDQIRDLVLKAPNLEAAGDELAKLLSGQAPAELLELVARALFEARLAGLTGGTLSALEEAAEQASA